MWKGARRLNKFVSAKFGIFFATAALVFAAFAFMLLNGSFAWFAENRDVGANGFSVTVQNGHSVTAELISRPVLDINTETGDYTIDNTAISYELPIDDEYNITYSKYMKALAVIVTFDATEAVVARIEVSASSVFDTVISNDNYISNCIQISTSEDYTPGSDTVRRGALTKSFVRLDSGDKLDTIDLGKFDLPAGQSELCFIIEYNDDLLKYIGEGIMMGDFDDPLVTYSNDIKFKIYV